MGATGTTMSRLRLSALMVLGALLLVTVLVLFIGQSLDPSPMATLPVLRYTGEVFPDDPMGFTAAVAILVAKIGFGLALLGSLVLIAAVALRTARTPAP